jgi:hypothetical protein
LIISTSAIVIEILHRSIVGGSTNNLPAFRTADLGLVLLFHAKARQVLFHKVDYERRKEGATLLEDERSKAHNKAKYQLTVFIECREIVVLRVDLGVHIVDQS